MKMTMTRIAKLAGVSVSTVSKILNHYDDVSQETRDRVLRLMEEHGYSPSVPAKTQASRKSSLIGVIYAGKINAEFKHPFFIDVINAFKQRMGLLGYDLLFFSNEKFHYSGQDYLARCRASRVDGCIIVCGEELEPSVSMLDRGDIPCIGIDLELTGSRSGFIMSDNVSIADKVVERFYLNGYRDIGFLGSGSPISQLREQSFVQAMQRFGLTVNPAWIAHGTDFQEQSGHYAMQAILQSRILPRALFAASDQLAIGAMTALKEAGIKIPDDVAVIGCDDIDSCEHVAPSLSTMRQDKVKIGTLAALMLFDLMNNQLQSGSVMVEPELVVRQSCGSLPAE